MPLPTIPSGNVTSGLATGYDVANSCLFSDGDSAHLSKTFSTDGTSMDIGTFSVWLKRSRPANEDVIFSGGGSDRDFIRFESDDTLSFRRSSGSTYRVSTNRVFRDPSAWYHFVFAWDTTQSTDTNRYKLYVNGVQETSFGTSTYPAQNQDLEYGANSVCTVGKDASQPTVFGGYMAEVFYIDGTQYAASNFGEYDSNSPSIWKPKDCKDDLTFGTNGFYFDFADSGDLGDDESGNTNDFTENNLAAVDQCIDSPTNNLATLNPLHMSDPSANFFVDNGANTLEATNNDVDRLVGVTIHPQGIKGYFEFKALTDNNWRCALQEDGVAMTKNNYTALSSGQFYGLDSSGHIAYANGGSSTYHINGYISGSTANGDIIGCAFDFTGSNRNVWFHLNGTYGNNGSGVGVPATGAYPGLSVTQLALTKEFEFVFMCNTGGSSSSIGLNFGNGSYDGTAISSAGTNASFGKFEYDCPSGFGAICSKTLNGTYS